jgi:DNA-binding PadR family transcriptional regulator
MNSKIVKKLLKNLHLKRHLRGNKYRNWRNYVKITPKQKEEILKQWESMVSKNEVFTGSSAADDWGGVRARELKAT